MPQLLFKISNIHHKTAVTTVTIVPTVATVPIYQDLRQKSCPNCHKHSNMLMLSQTMLFQSSQQSQLFQHGNVSDKSFVPPVPIILIVPKRNNSDKNAGNGVTIVPKVPIRNFPLGSKITIYSNSCACFCGLENCQRHHKICYTLYGLELPCFSVENM